MLAKYLPGKKTILVLIAVLTTALAFGGFSAAQGGTAVKTLSLEQAVDLAMTNNVSIKQQQIAVDRAAIELKRTQNLAKDSQIPDSIKGSISAGMQKKFNPVKAAADLTLAQKTLDNIKKTVKFNVHGAYYGVLTKAHLLEIKQLSLQRTQDQLRLAQANFKAGRFAKVDVTAAETQVAGAQAELTNYTTEYKVAVMQFNQLIGLDIKTPIKLTAPLVYSPIGKVDIQKSVDDAVYSSLDVANVEYAKTLADATLAVQKDYYTSNVYSYQEYQLDVKTKELTLENTKVSLQIAVQKAYMNLQSAEANIKQLGKAVDNQRESVRVLTLKYKVGLATNSDLQDANLALDKTEENYSAEIYNYVVAKAEFENNMFPLSSSTSGSW